MYSLKGVEQHTQFLECTLPYLRFETRNINNFFQFKPKYLNVILLTERRYKSFLIKSLKTFQSHFLPTTHAVLEQLLGSIEHTKTTGKK